MCVYVCVLSYYYPLQNLDLFVLVRVGRCSVVSMVDVAASVVVVVVVVVLVVVAAVDITLLVCTHLIAVPGWFGVSDRRHTSAYARIYACAHAYTHSESD